MRWNPRICERALRKQEQKKKEGAGTVLWGAGALRVFEWSRGGMVNHILLRK